MMENHDRSQIVGNSQASYINNSLLPISANMTNSYDVDHPSEPNYEAIYSGGEQGLGGSDACPVSFSAPSLGGETASFKWYAEDMQGVGNPACEQGATDPDGSQYYARKHVVMFNHTDTPASDGVPYTQLAADIASNSVPRLAFVSPNLCDDMHDSCGGSAVANGDAWLAGNLPSMLAYANAHSGIVIVTWDEDNGDTGQIATFIVGPAIKIGTYNELINHYNILSTVCKKLGLTNLGSTAINDIFK
jgi:phosphatidylinositol-3-phosphatase